MDNEAIARNLAEASRLLQKQGANPFRVDAFRHAAEVVTELDRPLAQILDTSGYEGLVELPAIGRGIAAAIEEMLETGSWSTLERLRGASEPEALLQLVPGIGPELASRIHQQLHVESLEALARAVVDGRLEQVPGIGPRRLEMIAAGLSARLDRRWGVRRATVSRPPVATLLAIDREYREG